MSQTPKTPVQNVASSLSKEYAAVSKFTAGNKRDVFGKRGAALSRSLDRFVRDTEIVVAEEVLAARLGLAAEDDILGISDLIFDATYRISSNTTVKAAVEAADARMTSSKADDSLQTHVLEDNVVTSDPVKRKSDPRFMAALESASLNLRLTAKYVPLLIQEAGSDLKSISFHVRRSLQSTRAKSASILASRDTLARHLNLVSATSFLTKAKQIRQFGNRGFTMTTGLVTAAVAGGLMLAVDVSLPREALAAGIDSTTAATTDGTQAPLWAYPITIRESTMGFLDGNEPGVFTPPSEKFVSLAKEAMNLITADPVATEQHIENALVQLTSCAERELPCRVETMGIILDSRHSHYTLSLSKFSGYGSGAVLVVDELRGHTNVIDQGAVDFLADTNEERFGIVSTPVDNTIRH